MSQFECLIDDVSARLRELDAAVRNRRASVIGLMSDIAVRLIPELGEHDPELARAVATELARQSARLRPPRKCQKSPRGDSPAYV